MAEKRTPEETTRPLDRTIADLIEKVSPGRGFAVQCAAEAIAGVEGDKASVITYNVLERAIEHDEWESPAPYRAHTVEDVGSIVSLAKKYSTPEVGLIFYSDNGVQLVYGEEVEIGQREIVTLKFGYSAEWKAWDALLRSPALAHRTLLTHLINNQHTVDEPAIIDRMREVKATFTAKIDSDLRVEKETVGVVFSAAASDELIKFPKKFRISFPVLDLDINEPEEWHTVEIRLEFILPTEPKQPVQFQLLCPEWTAIRKRRIEREIGVLTEALEGWTIVRGQHAEKPRTLGR